jgi:hypothetical protein
VKNIVTAAMVCATAIAIAFLLRIERVPTQQRYQLCSVDETSSGTDKTVKSVYRHNYRKDWRMSARLWEMSRDAQNQPMVNWADGWEEMPESTEAAVALEQAQLRTILQKP